jgi:hypothetical protein
MDLPTTLVLLLVAAALVGWVVGACDGKALEAFGSGFIGYRSYGWPRGVQEEEPIHFSFREPQDPAVGGTAADDVDDVAEIVELDGRPEEAIRLQRLG